MRKQGCLPVSAEMFPGFLSVEDRDHTGERRAVSAFSEFLCRGKKKVTVEFALSALSYNI